MGTVSYNYGRFKNLCVPDTMKISPGALAGNDNETTLWVQLIENDSHSFLLQIEDQDICESSIAYTKSSNPGATDISFSAGGKTWTGVSYRYMDIMDCFQVYTMFGSDGVLVGASWYQYNSIESQIILNSINIMPISVTISSLYKTGIVSSKNFVNNLSCPYDLTIYVEPDNSQWIRIFHHNNPVFVRFFSFDDYTKPIYIYKDAWFYVQACNLITNNQYELMVKQQSNDTAAEVKYRWIQTVNPMIATYGDVDAADITKITTTGYSNVSNYGGIYCRNSLTYLCANDGTSDHWACAIGSWKYSQDQLPGYNTSITNGYLDLYLRIDNQFIQNSSIATDYIQTNNIIEY